MLFAGFLFLAEALFELFFCVLPFDAFSLLFAFVDFEADEREDALSFFFVAVSCFISLCVAVYAFVIQICPSGGRQISRLY